MFKITPSKIIMLFLFFLFFLSKSSSYPTNCRTTGKWTIVPIPKQTLLSILPKGVFFEEHPFEMSPEEHPVFLEFNVQHDCWTYWIFPSQNMHEFKIQIPYVRTEALRNLIHKPLLVMDTWLNVEASKLVYGLPAYLGEYHSKNDEFSFNIANEKENIRINANFSYVGNSINNYEKVANFQKGFVEMNKFDWITDGPSFNPKDPYCAANSYSWDKNADFRYMSAEIDIQWGDHLKMTFSVEPLVRNITGGIAVDVDLSISSRRKCLSTPA